MQTALEIQVGQVYDSFDAWSDIPGIVNTYKQKSFRVLMGPTVGGNWVIRYNDGQEYLVDQTHFYLDYKLRLAPSFPVEPQVKHA